MNPRVSDPAIELRAWPLPADVQAHPALEVPAPPALPGWLADPATPATPSTARGANPATRLALPPRSFATLLALAGMLAGSVVAARIALDSGASVYTTLAVRGVATTLFLVALCRLSRLHILPSARQVLMLGVIGLLLGLQGICLYSALRVLSVAIAVLTFNTFPVWIALASWALYRRRPGRAVLLAMPVILIGLALALDVSGAASQLGATTAWSRLGAGVALALAGSVFYALALVLTQHEVSELDGRFRSASTLLVVSLVALAAVWADGGPAWPGSNAGWWALAALTVLAGSAIAILFTVLPRLGVVGNSPIMSVEPVMALILAALILEQHVSLQQLLGVVTVVGTVMFLGLRKS